VIRALLQQIALSAILIGRAAQTACASDIEGFESPVAFPPFEAGDCVAFQGDSITASGDYVHMIRLFYATRFPDRPVRIYNCGIGGARAETSWPRIDAACLDLKPTMGVINLGMNDAPGRPTRSFLGRYQDNMTRIMNRVAEDPQRKLTVIVPSPYDQTTKLEAAILAGKNDRIRAFGEWLVKQGRERKAPVIDFNTPMLRINAERQSADHEWGPFSEELNREWLIVKGLQPGFWSLTMEGRPVGEFKAAALAAGVDLAREPQSPGYRRAQEVYAVAKEIETAERNLRAIARARWIVLEPRGIDLDDRERADAAVRDYVAKRPDHTYWQSRAEIFFRLRAPEKREAERVRMEGLMDRLYEINKPKPQRVELRLTAGKSSRGRAGSAEN